MSTYQIYAYISLKNLQLMEELREKNNERGYSKILDAILDRHFATAKEEETKINNLYKVIEKFEEKCNNYEYMIRKLKEEKEGKEENVISK